MNPTHEVNRMLAAIAQLNSGHDSSAGRGASLAWNMSSTYGYDELGSGHFSAVFAHPSDPSLVIKVGGDVKDSWLGFAMYVHEHPASCFPRIEQIILHQNYYIAIMERLSKWRGEPGFPSSSYERIDWVSKRLGEPAVRMFQVLGKYETDLHRGNFMMRGDELVLTDPYACRVLRGYDPSVYIRRGTQVDLLVARAKEKARERRMAALCKSIEAGGEAKGQALRDNTLPEPAKHASRIPWVLPPVQSELLRGPRWDAFVRGVRGLQERKRAEQDHINARRRNHELHGRRADILIVDDVACQRGNNGRPPRGVWDIVEQEIRQSDLADMRVRAHRHLAAIDFAAIERRVAAQACGIRAEVHPGRDKPRPAGVQQPVRPSFLGREHWRKHDKAPRGLRYNGGCAKRDQGGRVPAGDRITWDEPRAGEAGPCSLGITEVLAGCRLMG